MDEVDGKVLVVSPQTKRIIVKNGSYASATIWAHPFVPEDRIISVDEAEFEDWKEQFLEAAEKIRNSPEWQKEV